MYEIWALARRYYFVREYEVWALARRYNFVRGVRYRALQWYTGKYSLVLFRFYVLYGTFGCLQDSPHNTPLANGHSDSFDDIWHVIAHSPLSNGFL